MKSLLPRRFHILFLTAIISLSHCLSGTQVLAGPVDDSRQAFGLTPDFTFAVNTDSEASASIAAKSLKNILPRLVRNNTIATELGFDDMNELGQSQNNASIFEQLPNGIHLPYLVFEIYLPNLQNLGIQPPGFGEDLLKPTGQLLVPISVHNKIKSSLSLRLFAVNLLNGQQKKKFEVRRWGSKTLIEALTEARVRHQGGMGTFLVQIPALNRDYLGYLDSTPARGLHLITLFEDQHFDAGKDLPAQKILKALVDEAKTVTVDDGPR
jgi:hypothetical protein